jgi:toxin ParE1/3/4
MEYQIIWSPNGIKCIHAIGIDLVRRDSVINANKVVKGITDRVSRLHVLPEMGRVVPELSDRSILEVIFKKKRIIYRIQGSEIHILAIVPERMALVCIDADWIWPNY